MKTRLIPCLLLSCAGILPLPLGGEGLGEGASIRPASSPNLKAGTLNLEPASTIDETNKFAFGANIGWIDWRPDGSSGAVIGEFVCSGYLYAANVGWINLGSGAPADGVRYQNNSATDFGVNHDGLGNLRGYAYGANIGWLNFTNRDATGASYHGPKVDLLSGRISGYVWSANCGWISLSNAQGFVQTGSISSGNDSDHDGIPDAWELLHFSNLTTANGTTDFDHDGFTDLQEYLADTDPVRADSNLRITSASFGSHGTDVTISWNSRPGRFYQILERSSLDDRFNWTDAGLGLLAPEPSDLTTRTFLEQPASSRFFQIKAVRPLLR